MDIDKIPDKTQLNVGLDGDQMFQRWVLARVFQRKEMTFERRGLPDLIGFLTGMDSQYFSLSTTDSFPPVSHVLPRSEVTDIYETNRSLHELDERVQIQIKRFTQRLHRACEEELIPTRRMPVPQTDRVRQESV